MKKLFFTVAILFSMATIYFTQIGVNDLPQAIRNAISDEFKDATISVAYKANLADGTKMYKVILNVEGQEESVMYNEDGSRYQMN